jgi:hypothetical protein
MLPSTFSEDQRYWRALTVFVMLRRFFMLNKYDEKVDGAAGEVMGLLNGEEVPRWALPANKTGLHDYLSCLSGVQQGTALLTASTGLHSLAILTAVIRMFQVPTAFPSRSSDRRRHVMCLYDVWMCTSG